ncbi:hypothetical protein [Convivina intestini]|uniref:hypothetical protein n=1 Tax=Convivina intestini TaxID=1505726 RepID=UPI00200E3CA0|nr:hypothetical protein [Convivina intestini]CAH1857015.1 hypothetical protein R078131_01519 [Convivina intestini]
MGDLLSLLIFGGVCYLAYKYFAKPMYRVVMTDPVTGYIRYLMSVDGINNTFQYTGDSKQAITFKDGSRAERFMQSINQNSNPWVEVKKFGIWKKLDRG